MEKNCAFQYVKISGQLHRSISIICDKTELTLDQSKELWNTYFPDCANHIKNEGTCEMVIWINMATPQSYGDSLQYISTDAESDGISIWENRKIFFPNELK